MLGQVDGGQLEQAVAVVGDDDLGRRLGELAPQLLDWPARPPSSDPPRRRAPGPPPPGRPEGSAPGRPGRPDAHRKVSTRLMLVAYE